MIAGFYGYCFRINECGYQYGVLDRSVLSYAEIL